MSGFNWATLIPIALAATGVIPPSSAGMLTSVEGINGPVSVGSTPIGMSGTASASSNPFSTIQTLLATMPNYGGPPLASAGASTAGTTATTVPISTANNAQLAGFQQLFQDIEGGISALNPAAAGNAAGQALAAPITAGEQAISSTVIKLAIDAALVLVLVVALYAVIVPEPGKTAVNIVKGGAKLAVESAAE